MDALSGHWPAGVTTVREAEGHGSGCGGLSSRNRMRGLATRLRILNTRKRSAIATIATRSPHT